MIQKICGKISQYLHSDVQVEGKSGSMVRVTCQTDFAAKTPNFTGFANRVAMMALAASATCWGDIIKEYPEMEDERLRLSGDLKETITVDQIVVFKLENEVEDTLEEKKAKLRDKTVPAVPFPERLDEIYLP